jgi:F-type H+-transporting ATPase subunit alpha
VNELLEFEDGTLGLALNLDEDTIGAVVLGEVDNLEEEQTVKATGRIQTVPVGDALLGRVVNALGEPIDGKGPIQYRVPPHGGPGPRHRRPPAGERAAADGHQGH